MTREEKLKTAVTEAWRNAVENGYEEQLRAEGVEGIAADMIAYDDDVSELAEGDPDSGDYGFDALEKEIIAILPAIMDPAP